MSKLGIQRGVVLMEKIILLELSKRCGVNGKDYFIGNN